MVILTRHKIKAKIDIQYRTLCATQEVCIAYISSYNTTITILEPPNSWMEHILINFIILTSSPYLFNLLKKSKISEFLKTVRRGDTKILYFWTSKTASIFYEWQSFFAEAVLKSLKLWLKLFWVQSQLLVCIFERKFFCTKTTEILQWILEKIFKELSKWKLYSGWNQNFHWCDYKAY